MKAWFGDIQDSQVILAGHSAAELAKWASSADSRGLDKGTDLVGLAKDSGLCASFEGYRQLLHDTAMVMARRHVTESLSSKDAYIIQAIKALDDVNGSYNALTERLAEWYGVHFPEMHARPQDLITFILQFGNKESSNHPKAPGSIGASMAEPDTLAVQGLAAAAQKLFEERRALEKYISSSMEDFAPNLSTLLGPLLAARFIALAGGLERLARMPASTIQVMGAGEALFKHLRSGTPSPKHGLIFNHPLVSGSPKRIRGKVARMLAARAAIAARIDYYSGESRDMGDVKKKVEEIKKRSGRKKH